MILPLIAGLLAIAAPAAPAPKGPIDENAAIAAILTREGFSAAGLKQLETRPAGLDARLAAFRLRASKIGQELAAAKAANDLPRFGAAMHAGDTLNAEIQRSRTDQLIQTMGALSPADRTIFLRHVGPPAAKPAAR